MLFARSGKLNRLKTHHLVGSQGVVCKICEPPLLVPQSLLLAILFHLLGVVPAVFLPIARVRVAPLPRTFQAGLLVCGIGSDLLPMISGAALALACGFGANLLLGMITVGFKGLPAVTATTIAHQPAPEENERGFILSASAIERERASPRIQRV